MLLFESGLEVEKIRSFDKDEGCYKIADTINRPYVMSEWKFKAQTADIHLINYRDGHTYNTYRKVMVKHKNYMIGLLLLLIQVVNI